jgi:predicted ATP-dependent endonuclease of OLD family
MHIEFVEIQNFRKLKSIRIDFSPKTTLFVGANNSGKTSAMTALVHFLVNQTSFTANDFTLSHWADINQIGADWQALVSIPNPAGPSVIPWMAVLPSMDLWLNVGSDEIHYVNHLVPTLDWEGGLLGIRLQLEPKDVDELYKEYVSAIQKANKTSAAAAISGDGALPVALWPRNMRDFLERRLHASLTVRAYSLDPTKQCPPVNGIANPQPLPVGSQPIEGDPLKGLVRIDVIYAQRDLADANGNRRRNDGGEYRETRKLSAQLRSYYDKHLNPEDSPEPSDLDALRAIQGAQKLFDAKLRIGFSAALKEVESLGYPGVTDPKLTIATRIRLTDGLNHESAVQYDVLSDTGAEGSEPLRLPEDYNGLGYQNLISMVFRLMSFRDEWMQVGKAAKTIPGQGAESYSPPPLHLILVEEPEVHLHAQVQQVFICKAYDLLRDHSSLGASKKLTTQLVVTTHSSHIAHECAFSSLRYFRRRPACGVGEVPITTVVNLSEVFGAVSATQRFVTRYLKATHCDLFFADAAILVEGPAERILVPQFVRNGFPQLTQCYLTLLEIGGSHAHRLRPLIEYLGIPTLVITDLDAAVSPAGAAVCPARGKGQVTRNATLKQWLPKMNLLDELFDATNDEKTLKYDDFFSLRVAYQCPLQVKLNNESASMEAFPNTFEDALTYNNLKVFREMDGAGETKKMRDAIAKSETVEALGKSMFSILEKLKKAEFALDLLELDQEPWPIAPPSYIREGLTWLQEQLQKKQQELFVPNVIQTEGVE